MIQDKDLRGYLNNRMPSRENCERVRAAGIVAEDIWVEELADTLLDIRQAVRGGALNPPAKDWVEPEFIGNDRLIELIEERFPDDSNGGHIFSGVHQFTADPHDEHDVRTFSIDFGKLAEGLDTEDFKFVEECLTPVCICGDTLQPCGEHVEVDPDNPCRECFKITSEFYEAVSVVEGYRPFVPTVTWGGQMVAEYPRGEHSDIDECCECGSHDHTCVFCPTFTNKVLMHDDCPNCGGHEEDTYIGFDWHDCHEGNGKCGHI